MRILSKIPSALSENHALEQYWTSVFPLSNIVTEYVTGLIDHQNTLILYSGGPRLSFDATYIEPAVFSNLPINWHQKTLFIDTENKKLIEYTIKKLKPKNLLILNSNIFIKYRLWTDILSDMQTFKKLSEKVIVTMPILRFDFNRLKFTEQQITSKMNGVLLDETVIVCQ